MAKIEERTQARELRKQGNSIKEIADSLNVSKSTVSYWCRDIPLSAEAINALSQKSKSEGTRALLAASERKRAERIERTQTATEAGKEDVGDLLPRDIFMIGLGLYWGEGYKRGNEELGFTNSDPEMMHFFIIWLESVYGIKKGDLILRVSINVVHGPRIKEIEEYWSRVTSVPITQFTRASFIKTNSRKVYSDPEKHFGTLRIKVRRGAELRRRILGSLQALSTRDI